MAGSCIDLRNEHGSKEVVTGFGKLLSGKEGYITIENIPKKMCQSCKLELKPSDKFCSNCGTKAV